ncbi:MAG: NACHT domain-containing protein [Chloroflexota bacterium]
MELIAILIKLFGPTLGRMLLAALLEGRVKLEFIESGDIAETLADSLDIDGLVDKLTDGNWLAKRRAKPLFDRAGEGMAERLVELFKADQVQISEPERDEVLREVQYVLKRRSLPLLLDVEMDAHRFRRHLRSESPRFAFTTLAQQDLFTKLLEACAQLVFAVADKLPHFTRDTTAKLLQNDSELYRQIDVVLRSQQQILANSYGKQMEREEQSIASEYRTMLDKELNQLHLFGVSLMKGAQQPLNVAFIYPKVREKQEARGLEERHFQEKEISAAAALTQSPRQLVVGRAGYGKTTLLKWGAVQAAAQSVLPETAEAAPEMASWQGRVPFFVQLRHFSQRKLPTLDRLALALPTIAELWEPAPPLTRWVKGELKAGRGIILLDGLDEINADKRAEALAWLDHLLTLYPDTAAVVSARPEALEDEHCATQLRRLRFQEVVLQQLEKPQVENFVAKWHEAMEHEHCLYPQKEGVAQRGERLLAAVRERDDLVQLAQTPLLCAMLCALHLASEVGELPRDRIQLYRRCIHLLLERDALREVDLGDYGLEKWPRVGMQQYWLSILAYWMLKNNKLVLGRDDAVRLLGDNERAATLADFLSGRSGILQRQTQQEYDFVHRSFQEYLAAQRIVEQHDVAEIVCLAHQKEWRETIRLLAGHGKEDDQTIVLAGLLDVAREHWQDGRSLHLLAWEFFELLDLPTQEAKETMQHHAWAMATELFQEQLRLFLFNASVSDVSALAGLTKLQSLDLMNTQVSDVSALAGLTKLQSLYLSSTQVETDELVAFWEALQQKKRRR